MVQGDQRPCHTRVPMSSTETDLAQAALQTFDQVVQSSDGFRGRAGQRRMAEQVAHTF